MSRKKQEVTGGTLRIPAFEEWRLDPSNSGEFKELVSACYKVVQEAWRQDRELLVDIAQALGVSTRTVKDFRSDIYVIRTIYEHDDPNPGDQKDARRWFRNACGVDSPNTPEDFKQCGAQVLAEFEAMLRQLLALAHLVGKDPEGSQRWSRAVGAAASTDPVRARDVIAGDLRINLPKGRTLDHIDRGIDYEWKRQQGALTANDDAASVLTRVVERYLVGWSLTRLPCDYQEILDRVDSVDGVEILAAIRLAHTLVDLVPYDSVADYLDGFDRAWMMLRTLSE